MSSYDEKGADRYDHVIQQPVYKYYVKKKLEMIKRWVRRSDYILDVGCGTGEYTTSLANHCKLIVGLDTSPKMIKRGHAKAKIKGLENIAYVVGDITHLPFCNKIFDVVASVNLIHHLVYDRIIFQGFLEKVRVSKRGSHIIVFELNSNSLGWSNNLIARIIRGIVYVILFPLKQDVLDNIEENTRVIDIPNLFERIQKINICLQKIGGFIPTYCPIALLNFFILLEKVMEATPLLKRQGAHVLVVGEIQ